MLFDQFRRRDFITLFGGAAAAWPLAARAQRAGGMRRIGVLMNLSENDPEARGLVATFREGLAQLGWIDGRNVQIDYRWSAGNLDRIRRYAAELVALPPEVILAYGGSTVGPLQQVTRTVPIVFVEVHRPGWRRLRDKSSAARWQHHRLFPVRIRHQRQMAGTAQTDHAAYDARGGHSRS